MSGIDCSAIPRADVVGFPGNLSGIKDAGPFNGQPGRRRAFESDDGGGQSVVFRDLLSEARLAARFERDVIPLRSRLYGMALRLTRNKEDAEDLVQDTILHAYAGFRTFREGTQLMAWLYRIMHNSWISHCRKKRSRPAEVSVGRISDFQLAAYAAPTANEARSAEATALESLPDSEIKAALMTLHEQSRLAVYYADVEGFSYREIADMMNIPVGTVMSRLHRGRRHLRRILCVVASQRGFTTEPQDYLSPCALTNAAS